MLKHILLAGILTLGALGALAGPAAANGPCQAGTTPAGGLYSVCLLRYSSYSYNYGGGYSTGHGSTNQPVLVGANQALPVGTVAGGLFVYQQEWFQTIGPGKAHMRMTCVCAASNVAGPYLLVEVFQLDGDGSNSKIGYTYDQHATRARVVAPGVNAYAGQYSYVSTGYLGNNDYKETGASVNGQFLGQTVDHGTCRILLGPAGTQPCGAVPVAPSAPRVPDFPVPPL